MKTPKEKEAADPKSSKPGTKTKDEEESEEEEAADPKQGKPGKTVKDESDDEEEESDPPEGDDDSKKKTSKDKKASKQSFLFESDCPACGGGTTVQPLSESETIDLLKKNFKEQVEIIISVAKSKIADSKKASKENSEKAAQYDEIFSLFAEETATMAVEVGLKKSQERDKYIETLKSLSFKAVQEIRSTLSVKQKPSREEKTDELRQSMVERAKQNLGTLVEDQDGKKKSSSGITSRPKFGLK